MDIRRIIPPLTRLKKEAKSQGPTVALQRRSPWVYYR